LSFGYANRSAVFLELKLYDECLENISLAREAGYPEQLLSKLADRETKCKEAISKRTSGDGEVKKYQPVLSYPASSENPMVADCIELAVNKKYGRHFVAKRDLKVGDIVILERPYQVYLHNEYNYRKCANCLSEKKLNLIPCPSCTKTMFCSRSCLEDAHKFHKTLCPIMDRIFERPSSHMFFTLRILLSLMHDFASVKALAAARASRTTKPGLFKYGGDEKTRQRNALDAFHDMEVIFDALDLKDAVSLALVYSWLIDYTDLVAQLTDVESQDVFLDLFFRYGRISEANSHATDMMDRDVNGSKLSNTDNKKVTSLQRFPFPVISNVSFTSNMFPLISLFNHSCAPNTIGISCNESLMAAMVDRPVKKGEQRRKVP
jgi:SET and MYND domain-containing protein 4